MRILKFQNNFKELSLFEKSKYINKLLKKNELEVVISSLVINDLDIIENFKIMNLVCKTKEFKETGISNFELVSLIIDTYIKQNKTKELIKYFKTLDENKLKKILNYEIKQKTEFSKLKLCKQLYKKDNVKTSEKKVLEIEEGFKEKKDKKISDKEIDKNELKEENVDKANEKEASTKRKSILQREITGKKTKFSIFFAITIIILVICYVLVGYCYYIISFYNSHVYPNVYLDNSLISGLSYKQISNLLKEKEEKLNDEIIFKNENDSYTFFYKDIGLYSNSKEIEDKVINFSKNLNGFQKLYKIFLKEEKKYNLEYSINDEIYNNFLNELKSKVNVLKQNEVFQISNGTISYQKGINGFSLEEDNIKNDVLNSIKENSNEVILKGNIDSVTNQLNLINKKVASFTTYYDESRGRATNIINAANKLNGEIIYPGHTFSFYNAVGPYNGSRGYVFYGNDVGSGVCQVSTTIYNAALSLNLPIVSRANHGEMVWYVDYGLDATVYGKSVDMQFRNNSNYPIYVESSAINGTLTVSLWSNEGIIAPGYSYKTRVEQISYLSYKTYLDTYYNGEKIDSKYLNSSYYVKGK